MVLDTNNTGVVFQSTLSMRRATRNLAILGGKNDISIHALHEESDCLSVTACAM